MTRKRALHDLFVRLACLLIAVCSYRFCEAAADKTAVGATLPEFTLEGPDSEDHQRYLGLDGSEPFKLSEVSGKFVLIDIVNAF